jgi:hypothetical protein
VVWLSPDDESLNFGALFACAAIIGTSKSSRVYEGAVEPAYDDAINCGWIKGSLTPVIAQKNRKRDLFIRCELSAYAQAEDPEGPPSAAVTSSIAYCSVKTGEFLRESEIGIQLEKFTGWALSVNSGESKARFDAEDPNPLDPSGRIPDAPDPFPVDPGPS